MKIVIDVDTDNPIHHAEGTDYFIPDLHALLLCLCLMVELFPLVRLHLGSSCDCIYDSLH